MPFCHPRALEAEVFAEVPFPGHPESIAVDRRAVYVSTHQDINGAPGVPSHIYAYNRHGEITDDIPITGQNDTGQGVLGLALDHDGNIYALDRAPSRILKINPDTHEQHVYAELPNAPLCPNGTPDGSCSAASTDLPSTPDDLVFAPDGTLYVTDLTQALIWRVRPGGGSAEVWYTSPDLDSLFGPNGIRFLDHGRTLLLAQSAHNLLDPAELLKAKGRFYTLEIDKDGNPGERKLLWEGAEGDTPDGFAIGRSGNIYAAMALSNSLLVLDRNGQQVTRVPATPQDNQDREVPFDLPAGVAFYGDRLLVTNQAFLGGPADRQVVFSVDVCERGQRLFRPRIHSGCGR